MTIARPTLNFDFANAAGFIDPRATFGRASTGVSWDRYGVQRSAAANVPRSDYDPVSGLSRGLLSEPQRTNLFLRASELDNAAWTKTSLTAAANAAVAADGTTSLERLAATGANGNVAQACAAAAGSALSMSFYCRASTSNWALLTIGDGTNTVSCWYNLAAGTVGTNSAGAGTVVFSFKDIEDCGGGLYRCLLTVATATSTSFTGALAPAAANNTATANTDEIFGGKAQFEIGLHASSFIDTAAATVTRSGDYLSLPTAGAWWNANEGTMLFDFLVTRRTPVSGNVLGGFGDAFANTAYLARNNNDLFWTVLSGSATQAQAGKTLSWTLGTRHRVAVRWKLNDFAIVANGGAAAVDSVGVLPVAPVRIMFGAAPYSATGGSNTCDALSRGAYWPRALSTVAMQTITAP